AEGNDALVYAVRGPADSGDPVVSADGRVDPELYGFGSGQELSAAVFRPDVHGAARGDRHPRMRLKSPRLFLLDIEGTVAPMSLVYEQLFPYARTHFASYLQSNSDEPGVVNDLISLAAESAEESDPEAPRFTNPDYWIEAIPYLNWLMDRDRKSTALKSL